MYELGAAQGTNIAEQAPHRLTPIAARPSNLGDQLRLAPWWLTSDIPPPQKHQGIVAAILVFLLVAGLAGAVGQSIAGYGRGGCLVSIALGFVGALLGSWLGRLVGLSDILVVRIGDQPFPLAWSIAGAALFVAVLGFFARRRPPPPA